jgi:small subunit ribosomal protein S8
MPTKGKYPVLERPVGENMVNYPVGDFLIKIKNAALARRKNVTVPYSGLVHAISEILIKERYLSEAKKVDDNLEVKVAYLKKEPALVALKLISKPGKRVYAKAEVLRNHKGLSFFIVSTPSGIMTSKEAAKKNIGGEVIAEIH